MKRFGVGRCNKMRLTAENVDRVFRDCLFTDDELTDPHVRGEGILGPFGFHPDRLDAHRLAILAMLLQLPDEFQGVLSSSSFLGACMTQDQVQWGEQCNVEQLMALGTACAYVHLLVPRPYWGRLPGGMPYFYVHHTPEVRAVSRLSPVIVPEEEEV